jgi:uncharacterized protein YndB with AHSA1/START domain
LSTTRRIINATPAQVWDVLADGWLYPLWVVGASRIRDVEDSWPRAGSKIHHSVGIWPLLIDDETEVVETRNRQYLRLRARGWPIGEAAAEITLTSREAGTEIVLNEDVVSGPGNLVPRPFRDPCLAWRNVESLRRLAFLAENRPTR